MSVIVRSATTDDLDALAALLVEITNQHAAVLPGVYPTAAADAGMVDYLRRVLALAGTRVFAAEAAGEVVGCLILECAEAPPTPVHVPRRWAFVHTLVVREGFRRRGIGAALLERVHAWAREQGMTEVELTVAEFNVAAVAWYERQGYATVERRMRRMLDEPARDRGNG